MTTPRELLQANLHSVFGNRDSASRRSAIDTIYTEDVAFTDPEGTVVGRDALEQKAVALLSTAPESFVFVPDGIEYTSPDTGALAWAFGPAGAPVARGIDIITITDGRISALHTLLHE
ncbi:nuclear transport factor 2 family protein [Microbacteriaceae bacterium VKM Ac-2854]|nr:nuclear transport factor 2 family protein [Microbacteriaceae bacterium VKM Ac-2854]